MSSVEDKKKNDVANSCNSEDDALNKSSKSIF